MFDAATSQRRSHAAYWLIGVASLSTLAKNSGPWIQFKLNGEQFVSVDGVGGDGGCHGKAVPRYGEHGDG